MERYQFILAYDGTEFHGSQFQTDIRTVQGVVEAALLKLNWTGKTVLFAGRTDAGVHASGQVAAFDLDWNHSLADLKNALNSLLPKDLAVVDLSIGRPDFHPRFDATARTYRYRIYCQPYRDPLRDRYEWRVWPAPGLERMQAASHVTVGTQDFGGYGRATNPGGSTIRQVMAANWRIRKMPHTSIAYEFEITANAFLYHMVRRLVYAHTAVGQGVVEIDELHRHLLNPKSEPIQGLAPPNGLSLVNVRYTTGMGENKDK
jgi:tRNA pseudouridine38-40 synthase